MGCESATLSVPFIWREAPSISVYPSRYGAPNVQILISSTPVHAPLRSCRSPTAWFGSTIASADMETRDGKLNAVQE
jgi:hypothetical protein